MLLLRTARNRVSFENIHFNSFIKFIRTYTGDAQLHVPDDLAEEVKEVREVANAPYEGGGTVDVDLSRLLVLEEEVVHVALHEVGLDGFFDFLPLGRMKAS